MNSMNNFIHIVLGMALVTYIPRMLPLTLLAKKRIPWRLQRFLSYIPVAVLSALLIPSVLVVESKISMGPSNPMALATLIALPVALKTKNMFITVILGMALVALIQYFA